MSCCTCSRPAASWRPAQPSVADGSYSRALVYSRAVALAFEIRGDDLISARLPALIAGLLLVAVVSGWITLRAGPVPGAVTGIVLAISPITVQMSVFARFYTFHALAIAVAVIAAFEATAPARSAPSRLLLAGACIAALIAAWQLQETTADCRARSRRSPVRWLSGWTVAIRGSRCATAGDHGPFVAILLAIVVTGWFFSRSCVPVPGRIPLGGRPCVRAAVLPDPWGGPVATAVAARARARNPGADPLETAGGVCRGVLRRLPFCPKHRCPEVDALPVLRVAVSMRSAGLRNCGRRPFRSAFRARSKVDLGAIRNCRRSLFWPPSPS